jgi:peptidoglycan-associated lipoprotein
LIKYFYVLQGLFLFLYLISCSNLNKKNLTPNLNINKQLEVGASSDNKTAGPLRSVYFRSNRSTLPKRGYQILSKNILFLKKQNQLQLLLEGHGDDSGSINYNIALGKKRVNHIKSYLIKHGIDPKRIHTISFGKEKPASFKLTKKSFAKNRRVNFVIARSL